MASLSFPPLVPPTTVPPLQVDAVAAAAPVALLEAAFESLPLPLPGYEAAGAPSRSDPADGAAMRPDQVLMARQLSWPALDGGALAGAWRGMVRSYGVQVLTRDLQQRAGQLPAALLQAGQAGELDPRVLRQADAQAGALDAWRFTVYAGGPKARHLRVVDAEPEQQRRQQERRRGTRAALRLDLILEEGGVLTLQAEPAADGIKLELCAPNALAHARMRELQPQLAAALSRAGVRVLEWRYREAPPAGRVHLRLPSADAAAALGLPVFRAIAELALLLPAPLRDLA